MASATLGLGSLRQKPRVGGTVGGSLRDGSDSWRLPVPRGDDSAREFFYLLCQPSLVAPADWFRAPGRIMNKETRWQVLHVLMGSVSWYDVAASLSPAVAAVAVLCVSTLRRPQCCCGSRHSVQPNFGILAESCVLNHLKSAGTWIHLGHHGLQVFAAR